MNSTDSTIVVTLLDCGKRRKYIATGGFSELCFDLLPAGATTIAGDKLAEAWDLRADGWRTTFEGRWYRSRGRVDEMHRSFLVDGPASDSNSKVVKVEAKPDAEVWGR